MQRTSSPDSGRVLQQLLPKRPGQIQPTVETAAGAAVDGAARRGVLVLQAHARERPSPNPTDGNASRQEAIGRHLNNSQKHRRRHTRNRTRVAAQPSPHRARSK